MSVYRKQIDLNGIAAFPAEAQVIIPFEPKSIAVVNLSNSDIFMSFNGVDVHGTLENGNSFEFKQRTRKLWLSRTVAGTVATPVEVIAEG